MEVKIRTDLSDKQKAIRDLAMPVFEKYGIKWCGLFGAYGVGVETENSFIDLYCERGNVKDFNSLMGIEKDLENALGKKVNLQFNDADLSPYFLQDIIASFVQF